MRLEFSELAINDLQLLNERYEHAGGTGSEPSELIFKAAANLESFPLLGPVHDDAALARRGFRKLLSGNYIAVYRVDGDSVVIYRAFDQRSNYASRI